jgi:hypothetical protein
MFEALEMAMVLEALVLLCNKNDRLPVVYRGPAKRSKYLTSKANNL